MIIGSPRDPKSGLLPPPRLFEGAATSGEPHFSCFLVFLLVGVFVLVVWCDFSDLFV